MSMIRMRFVNTILHAVLGFRSGHLSIMLCDLYLCVCYVYDVCKYKG